MLFSSLEFLFLFLPLSTTVYFLLPRVYRNAWLLISGALFYAFGEPSYLPIMLLTTLADYIFGIAISKARSSRAAKVAMWLAVVYNATQLAYFKFFSPTLPIGISFYSFQALSYVIDVYRESVKAERSLIDFGAYVTLYPQLIAGPIVRYSDVARELRERRTSLEDIAAGLRRFIAGLSKKVLLANPAGEAWSFFSAREGAGDAYIGIFFFAMQIYFDFSGYSDMAQGLGRMLGFRFPDNFNYPYTSRSITDFWRRWHITLSSFFREYVYIPLGGNRRGRARTYFNLLLTWALTGIWHGGSLNFLLWGLYFALIRVLEKAFLLEVLAKAPSVLQIAYAIALIGIGWVIFASDGDSLTLASGAELLLRAIGVGAEGFLSPLSRYELLRHLPLMIIMALGATPLPKKIYHYFAEKGSFPSLSLRLIIPIAALVLSVAYIVNSGYNPFLYFRF
jgi:alginate O-acetyltransferase complex protein AlgI